LHRSDESVAERLEHPRFFATSPEMIFFDFAIKQTHVAAAGVPIKIRL